MSDTHPRLLAILWEHFGVDASSVGPGASFVGDFGFDSLDAVLFVIDVEDAFGIEIPDELAERVSTVFDAVELVDRLRSQP